MNILQVREAAKKVIFLVARPLRGGGGKGLSGRATFIFFVVSLLYDKFKRLKKIFNKWADTEPKIAANHRITFMSAL